MKSITTPTEAIMTTMHPTTHEQTELSRCAVALYAAGQNAGGHLCSAVAAKSEVPSEQFDRAMAVYRAWLIGAATCLICGKPRQLSGNKVCRGCERTT